MANYTLSNAEDRHRENPDTFWIPAKHRREYLKTGAIVKLIFDDKERMWVTVTERTETGYEGTLSSIPTLIVDNKESISVTVAERTEIGYLGILNSIPLGLQTEGKLRYGDVVEFGPEHVIDIYAPSNIDRPPSQ